MFFFYCDPHALSQWTSQVSALPPLKTFKCCIVQSCLVYYVLTKHALIIVAEHYFGCDTVDPDASLEFRMLSGKQIACGDLYAGDFLRVLYRYSQ